MKTKRDKRKSKPADQHAPGQGTTASCQQPPLAAAWPGRTITPDQIDRLDELVHYADGVLSSVAGIDSRERSVEGALTLMASFSNQLRAFRDELNGESA
jgi:hypothetical protein